MERERGEGQGKTEKRERLGGEKEGQKYERRREERWGGEDRETE